MSSNFRSPLLIDNDSPYIGNSEGEDGRGRLHVKVSNANTETVPVADKVTSYGAQKVITVGSTAVPLRVNATNLEGRKVIYWQVVNGKINVGFAGITPTVGFAFFKDQFASMAIGPDVDFYIISTGGAADVMIGEAR